MARTVKKEKALTLEEKLQQALVPVEEQPYPVPRNWCWLYGKSFLSPMETRKPTGDFFNYIDIDSIDNIRQAVTAPKHIEVSKAPSRASRALHSGDTVFSMVRPYLKNIAFIDESIASSIASTGFYVCKPKENVAPKYLYYLMISSYVVDGLNAYMKGDNSPSIRKEELEQFPYPIPPLAEQHRIVSRIEGLFAKLDEAKEKAQAVVDEFEDRKAAILHKAFTGKLTEKWRKVHGIEKNSWKTTTIGECSYLITKGASPKWQGITYTNDRSQTLFVTSENIREGFFNWSKEKYLDNAINDIQKRSILHKGDVLLNIVGASIGRSAIFNRDCLANTNQAVCIVRVKLQLFNEYLCYYLNSPFALLYYDDNKVETARANISLTNIRDMSISLPSLQEQHEIVHILSYLMNHDVSIKTGVEQIIEYIDTMKKSILARAFRGELGTNDPSDESAEELLKRIL